MTETTVDLWVDDLRIPPPGWLWAKTADTTIAMLTEYRGRIANMSLDHDLGGEGMGATNTIRPAVLWLCEQADDVWPTYVEVHSWNPVGAAWLVGMCERYSPHQSVVLYRPSQQDWRGPVFPTVQSNSSVQF